MKETTFDTVKLIHGDCMEYMRSLPDNAFDLAVVDPPYGSANDDALLGGAKNDSTKEDGSRGITKWNRLKGGRRERYYTPPTERHRAVSRRNVGRTVQTTRSRGS